MLNESVIMNKSVKWMLQWLTHTDSQLFYKSEMDKVSLDPTYIIIIIS